MAVGVAAAAAIAAVVLQGGGMLTGASSAKKARKYSRRVRQQQLAMLKLGRTEELRELEEAEAATIGAQRAAVAGAGARVGRGTARVLGEETHESFKRARHLASLGYQAERKAIRYGGTAAGPNYASGLSGLVSSAGTAYQTYKAGQAKPEAPS